MSVKKLYSSSIMSQNKKTEATISRQKNRLLRNNIDLVTNQGT